MFPATVLLNRVEYHGQKLLQATVRDISQQKHAENKMKHILRQEKLLYETSNKLINIENAQIVKGVNFALSQAGTFLGADRAYLFLFDETKRFVSNTHEWTRGSISKQIDNLQKINIKNKLPWFGPKILQGEVINIPDINGLSGQREKEKAHFKAQNIKSLLAVPLIFRNETVGFIGIDAVKHHKMWENDAADFLRITGEAVVGALEKAKAEEALKNSEQRFRTIFENATDAIFIKDKNLRYLRVNDGAVKLFNLSPEKIVGKTDEEIKKLTNINLNPTIDQRIMVGEESIKEDITVKVGDDRKYYQMIKIPIENRDGKISGVCGIARDITELRITERALTALNKMNMEIVENSPFGIFVIKEDGYISYVNKAMRDISGSDLKYFSKLNLLEHVSYKKHGISEKIKRSLKGERFSIEDVKYKSTKGQKETIRNYTGIPFIEGDRHRVLLFVEDITEEKKAEQNIIERNKELETFNRIAVNREIKMIELKEEIKKLKERLGE